MSWRDVILQMKVALFLVIAMACCLFGLWRWGRQLEAEDVARVRAAMFEALLEQCYQEGKFVGFDPAAKQYVCQ